jgi:hypothetical protein
MHYADKHPIFWYSWDMEDVLGGLFLILIVMPGKPYKNMEDLDYFLFIV